MLPLSCSCLWNVLSLPVSLSLVGSAVLYPPLLLPLYCSCLWNVLSLPVSLSNVGSVVCCRPVLSPLYCSCFWNVLSLSMLLSLVSSIACYFTVHYIANHTDQTQNCWKLARWVRTRPSTPSVPTHQITGCRHSLIFSTYELYLARASHNHIHVNVKDAQNACSRYRGSTL